MILAVESNEAEWNLDVIEGLFDFYFAQPDIYGAETQSTRQEALRRWQARKAAAAISEDVRRTRDCPVPQSTVTGESVVAAEIALSNLDGGLLRKANLPAVLPFPLPQSIGQYLFAFACREIRNVH